MSNHLNLLHYDLQGKYNFVYISKNILSYSRHFVKQLLKLSARQRTRQNIKIDMFSLFPSLLILNWFAFLISQGYKRSCKRKQKHGKHLPKICKWLGDFLCCCCDVLKVEVRIVSILSRIKKFRKKSWNCRKMMECQVTFGGDFVSFCLVFQI